MFQPLLDVFVDSMQLPPVDKKRLLNLGLSHWWFNNPLDCFQESFFYFILNSHYEVICSNTTGIPYDIVFGALERCHKHILNFPQKRIGYTGENERINFDVYDFGMGFDHLDFHERYLRVPLYYLYLNNYFLDICSYAKSPFRVDAKIDRASNVISKTSFESVYPCLDALVREQSDPLKRGFASFVASNPNAPVRNSAYQALCAYRPVAGGGGGVFNTLGSPVSNKHEFLSQYKFNLCFENSKGYGYTTEKITDAYFAHTIPIYWGNPVVTKDFNPKSFVNVHDFKDFEEALDYIAYLDTHDNAYLDMLYAHPLNTIEGKPRFYQDLSFAKILAFLQNAIHSPEIYHEHTPYSIANSLPPPPPLCAKDLSTKELLKALLKKLIRRG